MTTQSFPISSVGCDPTRNLDVEDDLSIATPPIGYRNSDGDHEFVSKTIRFYFAPEDRTRLDSITPSEIHSQWLRIISTTFGPNVKIINNNNKPVLKVDPNANASKETAHSHQFKQHQKSMGLTPTGCPKTSVTIIHRILTRIPFGQIKRHSSAFQLLKEHNCFLREHLWDEQEWDVQQIGFVTGYNPKYYTPEKTTMSVRARLCKALPKAKVPKFQMLLQTHKINFQGRVSSTQAFTIEVPTSSVPQLLPIINDVTKETQEYVSFQMRRRNPEAFQGAIRYQNHILANQHVVMINHLGTEAMYYLTDRIQSISGVKDVIPTKKVSQNGKFYVLVDKKAETSVRTALQKCFDEWYSEVVPEDAKPKVGQFEGLPAVGIPRSEGDGYSSGENSRMTASTKSFLQYSVASMEQSTNEDVQYLDSAWEHKTVETPQTTSTSSSIHRPIGTSYASYAAATVSDQVSGMTETEPSRDQQHEELHNKIAHLEAMIVQLCHQVQSLTNQSIHQDEYPQPVGKRLDRKESPRKHKQAQQYTAPSSAEEGTQEPAPMDEDRPTAWDDYSPKTKQ